MHYRLTDEEYGELYAKLEDEEIARQRAEWIDDGGNVSEFRTVDVYARVTRRIGVIERERAEEVAENTHDMRRLYALN